MSTLVILALIIALSFLLQASFYWLGAKIVKAGRPTWGRAAFVTMFSAVYVLLSSLVSLLFGSGANADNPMDRGLALFGLLMIAQIPLLMYLMKWVFQTSFLRSMFVWLMGVLSGAIWAAAAPFVIKPFLIEAFVVPTNSMAPTLIGFHREAICPHCSGTAILTSPPPGDVWRGISKSNDAIAICSSCGQMAKIENSPPTIHGADRFIANKTLAPRRWDVIVFRYPPEPSTKYVMRLVGLPGEEVFIKDGAIWVNGAKTELPKDVGNWIYTTDLDDGIPLQLGTAENPWRLADNEVGVLGDFAWLSSDSRFWGPVPLANIEGVAGIRYWPPARFQVWK